MPTPTKGPRLGGSPAHERLILANLATALFEHGGITTTVAKAKRLRPLAERLVTFAKQGDLAARRRVLRTVRDKSVVHTLFTEIGPRYDNRSGGYTRIVKLGPRKGDNAPDGADRAGRGVTAAQSVVGEAERARGTQFAEQPPGRRPHPRDGGGPGRRVADRGGGRRGRRRGRRRPEGRGRRSRRAERRPRRRPRPTEGRQPTEGDADRPTRPTRPTPTEGDAERRAPGAQPTSSPSEGTERRGRAPSADERSARARRARRPARDGGLGVCSISPTTAPTSPAGPRQPGRRTVQETVEEALARVLRLPQPPRLRSPAGPTPACTRRGQVAHVDLPTAARPDRLRAG